MSTVTDSFTNLFQGQVNVEFQREWMGSLQVVYYRVSDMQSANTCLSEYNN